MSTLFPTFRPPIQVGQKLVTIQQQLGAGGFGDVYKVKDVATSSEYALKVVVYGGKSGIRKSDVMKEIQTLRKISHPNIIQIIEAGCYKGTRKPGAPTKVLILTEYCPGGNFNDRLNHASTEEVECKWILQMAAALTFLHASGIVHRDLKPENVLLTASDDIKVGDLGLAREFIAPKKPIASSINGWVITYTNHYMNTFAGSLYWMAPEVFRGHYNEKADVFSLGILIFAILERDFIDILERDFSEKRYYGAFVPLGFKPVGLGEAMYKCGPTITAQFSFKARRSPFVRMIALDALKYQAKDRPSAEEILNRITSLSLCNQRPALCPQVPGLFPVLCPQVPGPSPTLCAQVPGPSPTLCPQVPGLSPALCPQVRGLSPALCPQVRGLSPALCLQVPGLSPALCPQGPGPSPTLCPQVPGLSPALCPQVPGLSSTLCPQVPGPSPALCPQVPGLSPILCP